MSMWERERGNTRYLSSRQQSTGVLCPAPGGYVQGAATPLPPRALGWALKSSLGADAGMSPWLLNAGAAEICISDHPVLQPATLQHWGQMRRRGKGWAPKMGLALLCFLEGAGCQGNGGDKCPSLVPLHLLLISSALCANVQELQGQQTLREHLLCARHQPYRTQSRFSWGSQASRQHSRIPLGTHERAYTLKWCCSLHLVPEAEKGR